MLLFLTFIVFMPILAVVLECVYETVLAKTKEAVRKYHKWTAVIEQINISGEHIRKAS